MPIPDFQSIMRPMLELASDGKEHSLSDAREKLAARFELSEEERNALLPSGKQATFTNRVAWARVYLGQAGTLSTPRRGHFQITDRGRNLLKNVQGRIAIKELEGFPEFVEFRTPKSRDEDLPPTSRSDAATESQTPEELLETAYLRVRSRIAVDVLTRVKGCSPRFFENLVVELLLKMGYGPRKDAGEVTGKPGDEGIDGIINEDRLGLDVIYIQAKKWEGSVGRPEVQKFVGALHGRRARKGVFITTSTFSADAAEYVARIDPKVVLIDGRRLAELMIEHNVGVTTESIYETKRIDSDFFSEE